ETAANGNIIINKGSVFADGGQISISGTSSGKEIPLAYADNMAFEGYGKISISNASDIDVSGESSGEIKIQGNELNIEKSFINSYTRSENGGRIDIQLKGDMKVSNEAQIATVAQGMGNAGDIVLNLEKLEITGRGMVFSNSQANGKSGDILVNAHDSVSISGNLSMLSTNAFKKGDAGNVAITTDILSLNHNGAISAKAHEEGGTGGNISIAAGNITVTNNSEINTSSEKGKSGNITLAVNHLAVSGNGKISTGEKKASSGNIDIIS
ncbi:MAG: hypothetical protein GY749_27070, partial [Desulfobacteraceae bacterium]|nr:hypothetical protein [Desulfobacteraceae bacterium]